jgi:hypothetical protein
MYYQNVSFFAVDPSVQKPLHILLIPTVLVECFDFYVRWCASLQPPTIYARSSTDYCRIKLQNGLLSAANARPCYLTHFISSIT